MNQKEQAQSAVDYFSTMAGGFEDNYSCQPDFQERMEIWSRLLQKYAQPGAAAIDLGCGTGIFSFFVAEMGLSVTGVDGAADMVAYCRRQKKEKGIDKVRFLQVELPHLGDWQPEPVQLVFSSSVLEYIPAFDESLALCAELLLPAGYLILSMPNASSLDRHVQRLKYRLTGQPEIYRYIKNFVSPRSLQKRLAAHGLVMEEVHYYGHRAKIARLTRALRLPHRFTEDLFVAVFRKN